MSCHRASLLISVTFFTVFFDLHGFVCLCQAQFAVVFVLFRFRLRGLFLVSSVEDMGLAFTFGRFVPAVLPITFTASLRGTVGPHFVFPTLWLFHFFCTWLFEAPCWFFDGGFVLVLGLFLGLARNLFFVGFAWLFLLLLLVLDLGLKSKDLFFLLGRGIP